MHSTLIWLAAACAIASPALAAEAPSTTNSSSKTIYKLVVDRNMPVGYRAEYTGDITQRIQQKAVSDGDVLDHKDDFQEATFDVITKIVKVGSTGADVEDKVYFKSLKYRDDKDDPLQSVPLTGVGIEAVRWPKAAFTRDDHKPLSKGEQDLLEQIIPEQDPNDPQVNHAFIAKDAVSVGDSWTPATDVLRSGVGGIVGGDVDPNAINATVSVADLRKVSGVDCLVLDGSVGLTRFPPFTKLAPDISEPVGQLLLTFTYIVPTDTSKDIVGEHETASFTISGVATEQNIRAEITVQIDQDRSMNFVKGLSSIVSA